MGLDIWLEWPNQTEDEKRAQITGFVNAGAVGYLRSSSNESGFNQWARRHVGVHGFYHIFDYDEAKDVVVGTDEDGDERYGFYPDWQASRERTHALLERARTLDTLTTINIDGPVMEPSRYPDQDALLDAYRAHVAQHARYYEDRDTDSFGWYGSWEGEFYAKHPPTVLAVMWARAWHRVEAFLIVDWPGVHDDSIGVLEQVLQFIDLGEQKRAWIHWSG